jgi:hypothetical protein
MIIQPTKYAKCKCCGSSKVKSRETYGCDLCKKAINHGSGNEHRDYLAITVFYNDTRESKHFTFCSWLCCLRFLRNIQQTEHATDYFCDVPILRFDKTGKGLGYSDFFAAINKIAASSAG